MQTFILLKIRLLYRLQSDYNLKQVTRKNIRNTSIFLNFFFVLYGFLVEKLKEIHNPCLTESGLNNAWKCLKVNLRSKIQGTLVVFNNWQLGQAKEIVIKKFPNEKLVRRGIKQCGVTKINQENTIFQFL